MKKIGLFGDSFGYQHSSQPFDSWVDILENHFEITNNCQCGASEYKILQQLKRSNLEQFDILLITHTSPVRVFVAYNSLHRHSDTHRDCDIIYTDIADRDDEFSQACRQYFKHIFDLDYAIDMHNMICKEIDQLCSNKKVLHITHFDYDQLYVFPGMINFYTHWLDNQGPVNHYNQTGNRQVYQSILKMLS